MQYLLQENPKDHNVATQLGFLRSLTSLANCSDLDVRQAALQALVEIVRNQDNQDPGKFDDTTQLKDVIARRIEEIKSLNQEDLAAVKEERQLVDALWQLLYKQPSELRQEGLLVLPEDNQLPPDVASRQFQSGGLRGLSAGAPSEPPSGQNESQEKKKKQPVLLLGP
jgi:hsp70-interacting protein